MAIIKSERLHLIKEDLVRIGIGALVAGAGALLTFLAEKIPSVDFGQWTPVVVAVLSVLVNSLRKLLSETKY